MWFLIAMGSGGYILGGADGAACGLLVVAGIGLIAGLTDQ